MYHSDGHDHHVFLAYRKQYSVLFLSFFPWTQVRDKLLTLESFAAAETGLMVGPAQQFLSQNQRLG